MHGFAGDLDLQSIFPDTVRSLIYAIPVIVQEKA